MIIIAKIKKFAIIKTISMRIAAKIRVKIIAIKIRSNR